MLPRYFFNVYDFAETLDDVGTELADANEARAEAVKAAGEMLKDFAPKFWNSGEWRMRVTDETGATVCSLKFAAEHDNH